MTTTSTSSSSWFGNRTPDPRHVLGRNRRTRRSSSHRGIESGMRARRPPTSGTACSTTRFREPDRSALRTTVLMSTAEGAFAGWRHRAASARRRLTIGACRRRKRTHNGSRHRFTEGEAPRGQHYRPDPDDDPTGYGRHSSGK